MSTVSATQTTAARLAGRLAGRTGHPATACPFNADGDANAKVLAINWVRGYLATSPTATGKVDTEG